MRSVTSRFGLLPVVLVLAFGADGFAQGRRPVPLSVVVNEVMAANRQTRADPQGHYDDWIELYNRGTASVDIGGCYLTDNPADPTKWQIPANGPAVTTIAAHGYLLLWADGDVADAGLHASFRLSDNGEQVSLFAADGTTLIDTLSFGPQKVDVSYGRLPDGGTDLRSFPSPTPGAANAVLYEGIVEAPQISVPTTFGTEPIMVTLATATDGATIYFSLDGSDPLSQSPTRGRGASMGSVYTAPLTIGKTTTLKAVAIKSGWRQSAVSTARYIFLGRDAASFTSPLPIAVIDTFGKAVTTTQTPAYGFFVNTDERGRAAATGPIDFVGPAAINVRGKSSGGFAKKQYHLETQDERGGGKDVSILGFAPESDWVLQGMYSDKSLMRNVLPYQWSNDLGRWAAHTRFIELFVNSDDSDVTLTDYVGVYVFMEKIKVGPNRVDIAALDPGDRTEPAISGGYIFAKDKLDTDDQTFGTSRGLTLIFKDPKGPELTQAQKDWIRNYLNTFETALYGTNFADPVNGYARFIDVGSFIDNHIIVELSKNIDGFRLSTYYHKDRNGKLVMGPVWDYDLSFGNANYNDGWNATGWYNRLLGDGDYPYWRRLFEDPAFKLRYADRWFSLRRDLFTTSRLLGIVENYATLLDEPAARNYARWPTLGVYVWPNWFIAKTYREEIAWMKGWLADRLTWMDSQAALEFAPAPPAFSRQGGQVPPGFELAMTAPGPIYYTLDGSDPYVVAGPISAPTGTTIVAENAPKRVLVPTGPVDDAWRGSGAFDDSAWTSVTGGPGPLGYTRSSRAVGVFSLDLAAPMYGLATSCYVRIPFTFTGNVQNVAALTLRIRYNDGFVAYLNGVEVVRRNFTGTPAWNSAASAQQSDTASAAYENIPIIADMLRPGDNLLAIQGLNASATSLDFVIAVELKAEASGSLQTPGRVKSYTKPISLEGSTCVKARALVAGRWSALNEAVFAVGPVAESLRISEIMYHPADTGLPDDPNTEYVELVNIGAATIDLNFVRLEGGVEFAFPSFPLTPAGCCLVVKDRPAFEAKYGPGLPVAGQYTGSLSNAGERLVLQDAGGRTIHDFTYQDGWYTSTDGRGFSLVLRTPAAVDPNTLGDKAVWRPSVNPGGSPGLPDAAAF
ncbi:MAG: CotH kinase family protein [Planctomycetes bacterium]|nr:CotH kinase family protein [Planctomycetota bacterium]